MKQILAMGGGRFSIGEKHSVIEEYLLQISKKKRPSICFLATASGDSPDYILQFYEAISKLDCQPSHLPLIDPKTGDPKAVIMNQDIIYVGGGNTKNMLALWREWRLDIILGEAYESGIVLAGWSAGAICWFEAGVTDSIPGPYTAMKCLGFLSGSCCPHYDGEAERRPSYHRLINQKLLGPGIAIEDNAALHYIDGKLHKVVSSSPTSKAYAVGQEKGTVLETELVTHYLGS
jgi:dipeptidase E